MQVKAQLRYLRQSPRKVRMVCDSLRGVDVIQAENRLRLTNKSAVLPVLRLIKSAVANALNNDKLEKDNLFIKEIRVNQGPMLKRWRARAYGRAAAIQKKSSHVFIIIEEKVPSKKSKKEKKQADFETKIVRSYDDAKAFAKKDDGKTGTENKSVEYSEDKEDEEMLNAGRIAKDKHKQHLDKSRQKTGWRGRIFRRKAD
ncbi:50S ribosomal protein L22 [Candidatus Kuenenbacteria bacterium CG1_02_38_13]|uniref:Large ribosomal subunit protein uL22 n=1 Tax=Candidatus Kuenenbacteria bacterium CG1_02_38_13 TaxID=1805235 RepID=A0A1J4TZU1_9BACT|nr:MAG: 50S ribosomal protein L22 [Candidatus Kuenenbacteria bacterium CG1_02_38_13]